MSNNKQASFVPALEVERSPGGTLHCPDAEQRVLLEQTPQGRKLRVWRPPTTPEAAGCSQPKRARRSLGTRLEDDDIFNALNSSDDESDGESGDEFEDFYAMRLRARRMREEAWEEDLDVEDERVVEDEAIVEERGEERMEVSGAGVSARVEDEGIVEERREDGIEASGDGVNERVERQDSEMPAMGQEFVNLHDFSWSEDFSTFSGQEETYLRTPGPSFATQDPVEAFKAVWDEEIMSEIVRQTNKYAWDKFAPLTEVERPIPKPLSVWTDISTEELYEYFGMLILMSLCNRGVLNDYWTTGILGMPDFRHVMSRNRFLLITKMLHFVDNNNDNSSLSLYEKKILKIKPILDHCNARFSALYTPCKHLSLDESLLLWKGRLSWVQCIRTKAARFGIKSYELCEAVSGYLLKCHIYAGKNTTTNEPIHGFDNCTAKAVLKVMDGFLDSGHTLVMDNWYNQLSLTRFLKQRKTDVIGTMNRRRLHVPNDIKLINEKRMARGEQVARHCGDISLVAWKDVKLVTAVSTYHIDSRLPATRAGIAIEKPIAIADYNRFMGGVDSKDQQLSMFLMERKRGRKWYMKVFKRLLNTSLLNTFIIYKKNPAACKAISHREFRERVAKGLFTGQKSHSRPNQNETPETPRRLIKGVDHFVAHTDPKVPNKPGQHKVLRCVRCTAAGKRTMVSLMCTYCVVPLCAGRCWADYHTLKKL